ncbi:MAG TPA: hypothetical protein PKA27_02785 [Fimbriimonadaceae bacterium]|mgnify:CR=1 FL=1|nr:hypothetical protein [Fimbriimonadaceae bacterium]
MLKRLLIAALAGVAVFAVASDPPASTPKDFVPGPEAEWRNPELIKKRVTQKALQVISVATAPRQSLSIPGILNPSIKKDKYIGKLENNWPNPIEPTRVEATPNALEPDAGTGVVGFDGISQTNLTPPDPDAAVGGGHIVQVVNSRFAFYDKCGNELYANNFSAWVGGFSGWFLFDPKVIYDPYYQRWTMMIHARSSNPRNSVLLMLVSNGSNPMTSGWWLYAVGMDWYYSGDQTWCDYADLGYGVNALYAAGNQYSWSSGNYRGTVMSVMNKAQMYAGTASWYYVFPAAFTTRICDMYANGGNTDFMVSSGSGGGNSLRVFRMDDPFGAGTFTSADYAVAAYALAPGANNIGPGYGFDCRGMDARVTYDFTRGKWAMYLAYNLNVGGEMGARLDALNPWNGTHLLSSNYKYGAGYNVTMPCPVPDYRGNVALVHSFAGPGWNPSVDVAWYDDFVYYNNIVMAGGLGPNGSNRYGDYAGGSMDWDDFFNGPGGNTTPTKMWVTGEYHGTGGNWRTRIHASVGNGLVPPAMTVAGSNGLYLRQQGNASGIGTSWTVGHANHTGYVWEATDDVSWLTLSSSGGTLYQGQTANVTATTNANANSLPLGLHTGTVSFRNCFTGATITRTVQLSIGNWVCLTGLWSIYAGEEFAGTWQDVCAADGNFYSLFNDPTSLTTDVVFHSTGWSDQNSDVYCYPIYRVARPGLQAQLYYWNSTNTSWTIAAGSVASQTSAYLFGYRQGEQYISTGGDIWPRFVTSPINDEDPAQDGWLTEIDWLNVWVYPLP